VNSWPASAPASGSQRIHHTAGRRLRCAAEILNAAAEPGFTLRAGVHTGEIEIRPTDVTGIGVQTATRIATLAEPGEVLVSQSPSTSPRAQASNSSQYHVGDDAPVVLNQAHPGRRS
jgi:class 3 adenylate cyclase